MFARTQPATSVVETEPAERIIIGPVTAVEPFPATVDPAFGADVDGLPCRSFEPDMWFAETPAELEQAKAHCHGCPVRLGCLAGALDRREPWGVWGGEIFSQGVIIARKRPRGRPRKNDNREVAA